MSVKQSSTPSEIPNPEIRGQANPAPDAQLLFSRDQVCKILGGVSRPTVVRLEESGRLRPVRLNPDKATAKVFYRRADVMALIEG